MRSRATRPDHGRLRRVQFERSSNIVDDYLKQDLRQRGHKRTRGSPASRPAVGPESAHSGFVMDLVEGQPFLMKHEKVLVFSVTISTPVSPPLTT